MISDLSLLIYSNCLKFWKFVINTIVYRRTSFRHLSPPLKLFIPSGVWDCFYSSDVWQDISGLSLVSGSGSVIGREWSRDLDTDFSLVRLWHKILMIKCGGNIKWARNKNLTRILTKWHPHYFLWSGNNQRDVAESCQHNRNFYHIKCSSTVVLSWKKRDSKQPKSCFSPWWTLGCDGKYNRTQNSDLS